MQILSIFGSDDLTKKGEEMAEAIINFYEKHKKGVWLSIGFATFYYIGKYKGYTNYKRAVTDTVRIIKKEFEITAF